MALPDAPPPPTGPVEPDPAPGPARRLLPGRAVLRRDADTLQVGHGRNAVRLPDTPAVRRTLAALTADGVHPPLPAPSAARPGPDDATAAPGPDTPEDRCLAIGVRERLAAAGHLGVAEDQPPPAPVISVGVLAADPGTERRLADHLATTGIRTVRSDPTVWLAAAAGVLPRSLTDDLVRMDAAHLILSQRDGVRRIGPFVVPGHTACVRCVDAHESLADPRHPLLIEQAGALVERYPETVDPITEHLAFAWAVRDLVAFASGGRPSTWSATVDLPGPDQPGGVVVRPWLRHPYCGCGWDDILELP